MGDEGSLKVNTPRLLEVTLSEAPNVLTNDPTFFTSRHQKTSPGSLLKIKLDRVSIVQHLQELTRARSEY